MPRCKSLLPSLDDNAMLNGMPYALPVPQPREDRTVFDPAMLRAALRESGHNNAWLARALEVDQSTVSRWITGRVEITVMIWFAILTALGLPRTWRPKK